MSANAAHLPRRLASLVGRRVGGTLAVCLLVTLLLTVMQPSRFVVHLVYSLAIGLSSQAFIEAGLRLAGRGGGRPGMLGSAACVVLGALGGVVLGMLIAELVLGNDAPLLRWRSLHGWAFTLAISITASALATAWFLGRERLAATEMQAQTARRAASEAQLRLLESQLEPHMLFNTLATLRALIGIDPPRAQAMLDRLIAYLRATLAASRAPTHPLATEFARLDDYLALMALRMGPRLQVQLDLPTALREHPVPPLLLQPLVENAIRHGLEPKLDGGRIEVSAAHEGDRLVLRVRDTGLGLHDAAATRGTQFGSAQVRERLHALHGGAARFSLGDAADAEGGALAMIVLPWSP